MVKNIAHLPGCGFFLGVMFGQSKITTQATLNRGPITLDEVENDVEVATMFAKSFDNCVAASDPEVEIDSGGIIFEKYHRNTQIEAAIESAINSVCALSTAAIELFLGELHKSALIEIASKTNPPALRHCKPDYKYTSPANLQTAYNIFNDSTLALIKSSKLRSLMTLRHLIIHTGMVVDKQCVDTQLPYSPEIEAYWPGIKEGMKLTLAGDFLKLRVEEALQVCFDLTDEINQFILP